MTPHHDAAPDAAPTGAEQAVSALYERDACARALGIVVEAVGTGYARLAMTVRADMVNGHDLCHGGMTFTLADTAMAYAAATTQPAAVATAVHIVFPTPARLGDVLVAECRETHRQGRAGVYDIEVRNAVGVVAMFRGQSLQLRPPPDVARAEAEGL
jgi:acyl-CoA thioesterase